MREKLLDFQSLSSCFILLLSCSDFREANSFLQNYGVDVFELIESVILLATVWEILKLPELCQWGQNYYGLLVSINRPLCPKLRYTCDDWFTSIWSQGLAQPTDHYLSVQFWRAAWWRCFYLCSVVSCFYQLSNVDGFSAWRRSSQVHGKLMSPR